MDLNNRTRYYVKQGGVCIWLAVTFMVLSAVVRVVFYVGGLKTMDALALKAFFYLPLAAALIYVLFVSLAAHRYLWLTLVPAYMGVAFFVLRAAVELRWWHAAFCCVLYLVIAALYTGTVLGFIRTKWWLVLSLALPLAYHLIVEDFKLLSKNPVKLTYAQWMPEISVLCIMASLLFLALGMRKKPEAMPPKADAPRLRQVLRPPPPEPAPVSAPPAAPAEPAKADTERATVS